MKQLLLILSIFVCVNAYAGDIKKIEAKDAYEMVQNRNLKKSVLIDGRSAEMFSEKHIEGAVNIDAFQESVEQKLKSYLRKKQIIVYCSNFRRAELIVEKLQEMNYKREIVFISDGINGWIANGFEITTKN